MFLLYKSPKNIDLAETSTLKNGLAETSVAETSVAETSVHRKLDMAGYTDG